MSLQVYLTLLFLVPLVGACATLVITTSNVAAGVVLNGEPGWLCLLTCRSDVLLNAIIIHWLSAKHRTTNSPKNGGIPSCVNAVPPAEIAAAHPSPDIPDFPDNSCLQKN
ncbi:hypothetical protein BFJ69_g17435 [Fusarium oxysporum]|uniref:Uncharacterized protein n=1 Tax=Fusarium oxysporum TaxID=5507 RepID=A0A420M888_FUSOX|nr:hypothetical protein BFJ69_g17435 [Fusarium oxysporum]